MKFRLYFSMLVCFSMINISCKEDDSRALEARQKQEVRQERTLQNISNAWRFRDMKVPSSMKSDFEQWQGWNSFINEITNKPSNTLAAFQTKITSLTMKAQLMSEDIPASMNTEEVRSRLLVLLNSCRSLELYMTLGQVPEEKVLSLIQELNAVLISLEKQLHEMDQKRQIKLEEKEEVMLRLIDTSRSARELPKDLKN